ncbi:MAG: Flp family type IVb pilin [Bauldia sp.]|nr:Flp family type IVb pilin [Bauldia sp.]
MQYLGRAFTRMVRDETGSVAMEYALIGTLVSVAILVGVLALAGEVDVMYQDLADSYN